jgi:hypothetical protein
MAQYAGGGTRKHPCCPNAAAAGMHGGWPFRSLPLVFTNTINNLSSGGIGVL